MSQTLTCFDEYSNKLLATNVNYVGRTGESRNEDNGNKPIIEKWKVFSITCLVELL